MSQTTTARSGYRRILDSLIAAQPQAYTPRFHVARERWGWLISDGDLPIARYALDGDFHFDIWQFSPFAAPIMANPEPIGAVCDIHTMHNTVINLPIDRCGELVAGVANPAARMQSTWLAKGGDEIRIAIEGEFSTASACVMICASAMIRQVPAIASSSTRRRGRCRRPAANRSI